MYLIKGLLIFSPFLIYRLIIFDWARRKEKLIACFLGAVILIIIFSPFSFVGWIIDYLLFFITATSILKNFTSKWAKSWNIIIRITAIMLFISYVVLNSIFGAQIIERYEKGNLTIKLYRIPDMVAAPTHRLKITQTWGLLEKIEFEDQVDKTNCKYDFDLKERRLIADNCQDF